MDPLIPQGTAPTPPGTEAAPPQGEEQVANAAQNEGGEETDPEWEKAELLLKKVLFEGDGMKNIVSDVMKGQDGASAIAKGVLGLMRAIDQRTQGQIPEDYLMPLATEAMAYVAEGVEAAGRDVPSEELAMAMKQMLFEHLVEFGSDPNVVKAQIEKVDMAQLVAAMDEARAEADNGGEAEEAGESPAEEMAEGEEEEMPMKGKKPLIGG